MHQTKFITFEGGEGSGKSTQARLLADRLRGLGHEAVLTREPGGSPVAEKIRSLILSERPQAPDAEFLLFAAARAEHIHVTVAPALARGAFVICDRFIDSTRVYQGELGSVRRETIQAVEAATLAAYMPTLTFVLDVPAQAAVARTTARGDLNHYDQRGIEWHIALREAFQAVARADPQRCVLIDGARPLDAVAAAVWDAVELRFRLGTP